MRHFLIKILERWQRRLYNQKDDIKVFERIKREMDRLWAVSPVYPVESMQDRQPEIWKAIEQEIWSRVEGMEYYEHGCRVTRETHNLFFDLEPVNQNWITANNVRFRRKKKREIYGHRD